jgi:hypothetical protein
VVPPSNIGMNFSKLITFSSKFQAKNAVDIPNHEDRGG